MSNISSLFASIADERDSIESSTKQSRFTVATQHNARTNSEILFDLFPCHFMPYLDVDTFCNLLRTDVWDWHYLLSDRIVFDYMSYVSIRNQNEIEKYCRESQLLSCSSDSYDSSDTVVSDHNCYQENNITDDEEQNFAILKVMTDHEHVIDAQFIITHFIDIDIIYDRILDTYLEIGLTSNLCKNLKIHNNPNDTHHHHNPNRERIFVYDSYDELSNDLQARNCYNYQDIKHIEKVLLMDILTMCADEWYFVEWELSKNTYVEANQCLEAVEIKQMIIAHIDDKKYNSLTQKYSNNANMKQQLFTVWSIEWQQTLPNT